MKKFWVPYDECMWCQYYWVPGSRQTQAFANSQHGGFSFWLGIITQSLYLAP